MVNLLLMGTLRFLIGFSIGLAMLSSCAQKPAQQSDDLTKMYFRNQRREQLAERNSFQSVLKNARRVEHARVMREYPLPNPLTEESLYTRVISAYQLRELGALDYYVGQFVYRYPQSVFADSALYLRGEMSLIMGMTPEALRDFERIIAQYPTGKKYVAALYGKAVCYRNLQLYNYAEQVLRQLKKEFPGSPEVMRASLEEKMIAAAH